MIDSNLIKEKHQQVLTGEQVRVLAVLMEKHLATPKNYPLTPNSLTLAANQKSNRHPIMALDEGKVVAAAQQLKEMGCVSIDYGERIVKFSHRAPGAYKITREEQAVLAMLMLREPLTLNDLKARTEKMIGFECVDQVEECVDQLIKRTPALVMALPVAAGQREQRFTHLLAGEPDLSDVVFKQSKAPSRKSDSQSLQRIAELEARIQRLETALDMVWDKSAADQN